LTNSNTISNDSIDTLQCPECAAQTLLAKNANILGCANCNAEFPIVDKLGSVSLLANASKSAIKEDIQKWWGDLYKQAYEGHEDGLDSSMMDERLVELEDLFNKRQMLPTVEMPLAELSGKHVLEIGSGSGAHSALFKRHGANMTSVDITPERVFATARKLALVEEGSGNAYQADAENLPFRDNSFDIVYSNGVLHHSENTDQCINEVYRVLKPGGKAVIMLYSRHSAIFWLNVLPRAILTGEFFRWPEAQWIGRLTEGKPKFGDTKNPITRVYSARQMRQLFATFEVKSLRKNSFQFDNFCIPKLTQIRNSLFQALGKKAHPGGLMVYGVPYVAETGLELYLGRLFGFGWNIIAEKDVEDA
jgi:ubiquinone/menaquinone biosynthesis C-methylase UbiE